MSSNAEDQVELVSRAVVNRETRALFLQDPQGDVKASKQHGARRRAVERMPRWAVKRCCSSAAGSIVDLLLWPWW